MQRWGSSYRYKGVGVECWGHDLLVSGKREADSLARETAGSCLGFEVAGKRTAATPEQLVSCCQAVKVQELRAMGLIL